MGSIDWRFVDQAQRDAMLAIEEISETVALDTQRHTVDTDPGKSRSDPQPEVIETPRSPGGGHVTPPSHPGWEFFKSPQFSVLAATVAVLVCAAVMYSTMSGKVDALRLEVKADIQTLSQRNDARFDQVGTKFDGISAKMEADTREIRTLILNHQRQPQQH